MAPTSYTVLSLGYSDGVASTHPTNNTKPPPNPDGTWDYFRPVDDEEAKGILWRSKSAAALVEKYTPPEKQQPGRNYIFKTLPDGYKLFEHIKGKKGGPDRKDTYLFGHPNGSRFRSPAEFIPHVYHLASKAPEHAGAAAEENKSCQCKYCGVVTTRTPGTSTRKPAASRRIPDHVLARREICAEERLGEQEMTGYVMRKGEIVWVWTGAEDELDDVVEIQDSELWVAAMVVEKPSTNPPFRKPEKPKGSFADIEMDDGFSAPWQESREQGKDRTYAVQLCTNTTTPGAKLSNVPQHFLRPWLARPNAIAPPASYSGKTEHSTVQPARRIVETFSLFEKTGTAPPPPDFGSDDEPDTSKIATLYSGLFLGPEKIFVGDPVRISDPNGTLNEDVLVVEHIYTVTPASTTGTPVASSAVSVHVTGSVYHISKNRPITPEQFAQLPWRMRRTDPKTGNIISWSVRNSPSQRGELSIKLVLGRWYEPEAIEYWMFPDEQPKLGTKNVVKWVKDRAHALGWTSVNGVELIKAEDQRKPENAILASNTMDVDRVTPERGFKSINTPGSAGKSRMARAVEGDDDEIEEDDDVVDEPAKTPNRRLSFRPRGGA
ncbi:hypothetical protein K440DRAFT_613183 [Wilcoxina mikolae CBS 423.85]|nr:hypothetical protein K440DRAFT_613183 [Wilcoxina mikolae CBS 423.85]